MASHAGFDDRIGRDGEGQAVDDDAAELLALHVDSLPEAGCAEEDGVGGLAELLEQHVARRGAVEQQRIGQLGQQALVDLAHLRVAGEEAEGAAFGDLEHAANAFGGLLGKVRLARIGHVGRQIEQRLPLVVEVRRDDQLARSR